jgi:hypothetical protein
MGLGLRSAAPQSGHAICLRTRRRAPPLIDRSLADPHVHSVALTTEEEGVALLAGADLGVAPWRGLPFSIRPTCRSWWSTRGQRRGLCLAARKADRTARLQARPRSGAAGCGSSWPCQPRLEGGGTIGPRLYPTVAARHPVPGWPEPRRPPRAMSPSAFEAASMRSRQAAVAAAMSRSPMRRAGAGTIAAEPPP